MLRSAGGRPDVPDGIVIGNQMLVAVDQYQIYKKDAHRARIVTYFKFIQKLKYFKIK
jgi:hypothetical protein